MTERTVRGDSTTMHLSFGENGAQWAKYGTIAKKAKTERITSLEQVNEQ